MSHDRIHSFSEKPSGDGGWINGGFFVLSPSVGDYIAGDHSVWEREPLERLAGDGQLAAYRHEGFWQAMEHPARPDAPRGSVGLGRRAVEDVGDVA
jgi:glucose-1-phosphate cytidylyltransferase